jgi:hypothetical protein
LEQERLLGEGAGCQIGNLEPKGVGAMVPEIVRLERAGVCGCGELVAAGERAGYAPPQERVVCLACLAHESVDRENAEAARASSAVLPANWTADELVIAATLKALREASSPARRPSAPDVLHVPTEWSTSLSQPTSPAEMAAAPELPLTLPRRKPRLDPVPEVGLADPAVPPEPTTPTAFLAPRPSSAPPVADPSAPAVVAEPVAPVSAVSAPPAVATLVAPTAASVADKIAETQTRRSRHEAAASQDSQMPAAAPRRRAGLFSRLLTVRTFRAQQSQPRVSKAHASVRALLEGANTQGVLSLHNRRVPGRRGPIEHIAIGAGGLYVIDALHFKNASIEVRPAAHDSADGADDLVVGGRVMTAAVRAVAQRVEVLRMILLAAGLDDIPVTGALCFVDGLLPLAVADLDISGMHVLRPSGLPALVSGPGHYDQQDRETLRQFLAERLPEVA